MMHKKTRDWTMERLMMGILVALLSVVPLMIASIMDKRARRRREAFLNDVLFRSFDVLLADDPDERWESTTYKLKKFQRLSKKTTVELVNYIFENPMIFGRVSRMSLALDDEERMIEISNYVVDWREELKSILSRTDALVCRLEIECMRYHTRHF